MDFPKSKAKRVLHMMPNYQQAFDTLVHKISELVDLRDKEAVIGVYYNQPGDSYQLRDSIIITNAGLHIIYEDMSIVFLDYMDVDKINNPAKEGEDVTLKVSKHDKSIVCFDVKYIKDGRYKDAFEFMRFLWRVSDYLQGKI